MDKLIPSRKRKIIEMGKLEYINDHQAWESLCAKVAQENRLNEEKHEAALAGLELRKAEHMTRQVQQHREVDANTAMFTSRTSELVEYFFSEVLTRSDYPDSFPEEVRLKYDPATQLLFLDYELPNISALPAYRDVKYIATRKLIQEIPVSEAWLKKTYDDVLYQICLRTLYELFVHDYEETISSIVFNGWVRSIDKSTGVEAHACIMSIHVERDEFVAIRLDQVEPKACFRKLKGIASSKLTELTPIRPVMSMSREDARFVDPYAVLGGVDDRTNLASMDWLDFENLIREVFEKEFSKSGGEVKITQLAAMVASMLLHLIPIPSEVARLSYRRSVTPMLLVSLPCAISMGPFIMKVQ